MMQVHSTANNPHHPILEQLFQYFDHSYTPVYTNIVPGLDPMQAMWWQVLETPQLSVLIIQLQFSFSPKHDY